MDPRVLSDLMRRLGAVERGSVRYRQGVITDDVPLSVALGGAATPYVDVASITAGLQVGNVVSVLTFGNDLLVLGRISDAGGPLPGDLKASARAAASPGWLPCDGAAVLRSTYAVLYAALGGAASPHGQGDGTTTFNVPDYRGRGLIGAGTGTGLTARTLGAQVGTETHTLTTAEMPAHHHRESMWSSSSGALQGAIHQAIPDRASIDTADTGGGGAHPNMQPSAVVNWFIKT